MLTTANSRILTLVIAGAIALTGCAQDEDRSGAASEDSTGSTAAREGNSDPSDESASTAGPTEEPVPEQSPYPKPERPAAMDDDGEDGAIAAAEYFIELYNYVQSTGEVSALEEISSDQCRSCSNLTERIKEIYSSGGYAVGGEVSMSELTVAPTQDAIGYEIEYQQHVSEMVICSDSDSLETLRSASFEGARIAVSNFDGRWFLIEILAGRE